MQIFSIIHLYEYEEIIRVLSIPISFLQSWTWGEIERNEGKTVERLVVKDKENILAYTQIVYAHTKGIKYAFSPQGPVLASGLESDQITTIYQIFLEYCKKQKCLFWRVEPENSLPLSLSLQKIKDVNPSTTCVLDLAKTEEQILSAMHKKTRYSLRVSSENGLILKQEKNLEILLKLMAETGKRDGFRLHDSEHYKNILASSESLQLSAEYQGQIVATAVFFGCNKTLTYLYAASDYAHHELLAPYFIQWEAIKLAKKLDFEKYDFFGIAPKNNTDKNDYMYDENHSYAGITRFKIRFGGEIIARPGTYDLIISPLHYRMYQYLRKFRRWIGKR